MIYACAVTFTKLSIVLFYRRIFGMKWTLWLCAFLALSYLVTVVVTILVACRPIPYFWVSLPLMIQWHFADDHLDTIYHC